jgi:ABC-type taurine transport system ATPase subunit
MEKIFVLIEWREGEAVLQELLSERQVLWSKEDLPADIKIGDKISFSVSLAGSEVEKRKQFAKDILNEILS